MKYISTSGIYTTDLRGAFANCFAPDGSLYLPEKFPTIPRALFNNIEQMTLREIAYVVVSSLLSGDIDHATLKRIVDESFVSEIPFRELPSGANVLELFHGPTMAFKDFSARFAAAFIRQNPAFSASDLAIVATTGNTGAAVANAFAAHKGRSVVVLFPKGALSRGQLSQFTTLGPAVHAIEVAGDIGHCKAMVRQAMADDLLPSSMKLVCMNTANYLRIVPQVVLFFYAYARLKKASGSDAPFCPAIPCGNLSSLVSAIIAKRLGLPVRRIIAGCSANDDLARVLSGQISPSKVNRSSRSTLAKAMDSGYPTNIERVLSLYGNDIAKASADIRCEVADDEEIARTILSLDSQGYLVDPHTAVAFAALKKAGLDNNPRAVVFATAHPAKSLDTITALTGHTVELPLQMTRFMTPGAHPVKMPPTYPALRKFLLSEIN